MKTKNRKTGKRVGALILALTMCFSLMAGCNQNNAPANSSNPGGSSAPGSSAGGSGSRAPAEAPLPELAYDEFGNAAVGRKAAVVSANEYTSKIGFDILKKGGNAVDAAVAMIFANSLTEPGATSLGGASFMTIYLKETGEYICIEAMETAPAAAGIDTLDEINEKQGAMLVTVPGQVHGALSALEKYGTMSRQEVMEPAIRMATEGFTVSAYCANAIADAYETAQKFPEMQKVYLDEMGLPFEAGSVINNPDLAKALTMISEKGEEAFYTGEMAQAIVDTLAKYDGVMTLEDLAGYKASESVPVTGDYKGYTIISSPPPSSGGTHLIEILNILENFDVASMDVNSTEYVHLFTETFKLAFADRAKYMADTNFATVPLGGLTSQGYADLRADMIDMTKAMEEASPDDPNPFEHTDTTHYSVADVDGNCVAVTKTINYYFGSGVMVDGFGFMMNNQMDDFSTDPESVNKIEPGKKPLSSMSPTVVLDPDGDPFMVLGTPGGTRIFSGVAQVISRVIDHDMDLLTAVCVPKIWNSSNKNNCQYENPLKGYEQYAVSEETVAALTAMGHGEVTTAASGAMQSIIYLEDGTLYGVGNPRQDGKAVGCN